MKLIKPKDEKFFGWLCGLMLLVKLANYFHIIKRPQTCFRERNRKQNILMEDQQPTRNVVSDLHSLPQKLRETSGYCCIFSRLIQPSKQVRKSVITQVSTKEYAAEPHTTTGYQTRRMQTENGGRRKSFFQTYTCLFIEPQQLNHQM